jgi:hypothetical protein
VEVTENEHQEDIHRGSGDGGRYSIFANPGAAGSHLQSWVTGGKQQPRAAHQSEKEELQEEEG